MSIAHGVVKSPCNGELVAEFTIDGVVHQYTARFSPEIKLAGSVILTYLARDELRGEAAFSGESDGDLFDLHLSSEGVSIVCGSPAEQGKCIVRGLGTWNMRCPANLTTAASGIITATSSTTFVAVFYVDDVRQTFTATFTPPLSTFASDLVKLYFNNPGNLIGAPAFSGEVGISGLHIQLSSPGVTMSGDLRKHTTSRLTISGTGRWNNSPLPDGLTAPGTLSYISNSAFVMRFTVNDVVYTYTACFSPPIDRFESSNMTLTYQNLGQLIGTPAFSGEVGVERIKLLSSQDGMRMEGHLNVNLSSRITIYGTGTWSTTSGSSVSSVPLAQSQNSQMVPWTAVNVFNSWPRSPVTIGQGNTLRYVFDSQGNLVPIGFEGQFNAGGNIVTIFNSPPVMALASEHPRGLPADTFGV